MADLSFFWHDYETFGRVPRRDRPAQFAGVRTDADLNEIGDAGDAVLPAGARLPARPRVPACSPASLPQHCLAAGRARARVRRRDRAASWRGRAPSASATTRIRFDDEVTRHLFWRNLIDPYAREWQNECGRWDLLDVVRCTWALRPDGIEWPTHDDGRPSFKLEHLTRGQRPGARGRARRAVRRARHHRAGAPDQGAPAAAVGLLPAPAQQGRGGATRSGSRAGRSCTSRACTASSAAASRLVWPLAPHPTNKNELIVWDLAQRPGRAVHARTSTRSARACSPAATSCPKA